MPNLIAERGREKGQTFELAAGATVVVGRDPQSAQIVIADAAASRRHFQLAQRGGRWFVSDLGSKNFTFLNEERLEKETELANGDRVQVGETVFTFNDDAKADDKAAGLSGKEIGGYRILDRIGRGGMGTVFKAKQVSLNRLVALKFLSPKLSKDPAFVAKFFAEARAAAQLNHPNVVQVFDVGTLSGVHFFSMEFMEGGCVQDLLTAREDSRLPWQEALPLVIDSVRGLVFAEKRGIIHRDIKPDNLMLTSEQKVKIGDLGLATSAESETEKGIFGTPHFIAPEQAQGRDVTHAADLYSLGATFYRVVAGKTPFSGTTVKEILRKQINDAHVPVVQIVPDFPAELSSIIDKLMAKKVEDRYQSATKLLEDLEAFQLAHHIELAGGVKTRKPVLVALGLVLAVLAAVIYYFVTKPPKIDVRERTTTVIERIGTTGPVVTPEQIQAERDREAENAFLKIQVREGPLNPISRAKRADWLAVSEDYEKLRTEHAGSPSWGEKAAKRAADIRIELERQETEYQTVIRGATEWWEKASGTLKGLVATELWGDATRSAATILESDDLKRHGAHLPADALTWLRGVAAECYDDANAANTRILTEAQKAFDAQDVLAALKSVNDWEAKLRAQNLDDAQWKLLADGAKAWAETRGEAAEQRLKDTLLEDRKVVADAWRRVRHIPVAADDSGGSLWSYRFADSAKEMRAAVTGRVKTWLYGDRIETSAKRLDEAQAAWDAMLRLVAEKKLWAAGEEIKGIPGIDKSAKVSLDPDKPATAAEIFVVVSISGGGTRKTFRWEDYAPGDLYRVFVHPHSDRVPQDVALGLAKAFALLGDAEATGEMLDRARAPIEQRAWIDAELRAMQDYDAIVRGTNMAAAERRRAVDAWRKSHFRTEYFLLVDGRGADDLPHLFPDEDVDRFVDSYGARPK